MKRTHACLAAALLAAAGSAHAATSTSSFLVTATVVDSCTVSAADLAFGTYNPQSILTNDASSSINVTCTLLTGYSVALNPGTTSGATVTTRKMAKSTDTLNYQLFRDATRLLNWGQTPLSDVVAFVGTGLQITHTVYGRIPAGQNVPAGAYTDTITVTVTY